MNKNKLLSEIVLKGKTVPDVANKMNLSKATLYRKINGKTEFTRKEIQKIIECLELDHETAFSIFFEQKVS